MKTSSLALLASAALLIAAPLARADEKADALLGEVMAKTKAATTLKADMEMTLSGEGKDIKSTGTVTLKKPNLARIQLTGPIAQTIASDGKTLWTLNAAGSYRKAPADPQGRNINTLWAFPVAFFFQPNTNFFGPASSPRTRYVGADTIGGKTFQVVEVSGEKPMPHTVLMYIGPDKLFHRTVVALKQGDKTMTYTAALSNVETGAPVAAAAFAYTPPKTAKPYEPPNYEANLVPVGKKAPAFDLPTPAGGKLALENTLKNKKAVLVNFWFYN
jgi:outer membrane lipoprotein-sorting protein